ncbi:NUDIX hydrolase [Shewanella sp. WXL01]|uniref:NUDIX hydrolase n=1 Tax=Shewanella sp. WXL01 TaxID=2709721 RepID=UPI00143861C8|nr:NUDIX hydrolase [Shewanella sp. WXL01]NKF51525.1 NUDIX hydrolase [Shewanella sp. WXL01]
MTRYKPNTTVACIIHCQGNYLLVEEQIDGRQRFNQAAGHIEAGESIVAACTREVLEETGLSVTLDGLVKIYQFTAADGTGFVRYTFAAEVQELVAAIPQDSAITACHWMTLNEVKQCENQHRSPLVLQSIIDFEQSQQLLPLNFIDTQYL